MIKNPTKNKTVQVFVNITDNSIVLSTMRNFAKRQELDLSNTNQKTNAEFLEEDFFGNEKNAAELNEVINEEIKNALANGTLKKIDSITEHEKSTYTYNGISLIQRIDTEGNFTFRPIGKFTGILIVYNSTNDNTDSKQKDVVEYTDGMPIAVSRATTGKSKIANIDLLEKQAATRIEALTNDQKEENSSNS